MTSTEEVPHRDIAGNHGRNFEFMPGPVWHWSYFIALSAMASLAIGLLIVFRRKGWIRIRLLRPARAGRASQAPHPAGLERYPCPRKTHGIPTAGARA